MKGFNIRVNNEEISAAARDGHTMVSLMATNHNCMLYVSGYDFNDYTWRVWRNQTEITGTDTLEITVGEIEQCSIPVEERKDYTIQRRFPDSKLDMFHRLEEDLKNRGLI